MKNPWIVFIESNTSGTGRIFASKAAEYGYQPLFLVESSNRYPFFEQGSFPFLECRTGSVTDLLSALEKLAKEAPIAGIFSSSDYFLETAAILARACRLPGGDPPAICDVRNKAIQREKLQAAGLANPRFTRAESVDAAAAAACAIGLPVIVKPTLESGSFGVRLCRTAGEVVTHANRLLARTTNARGMPIPSEVLVEQYLLGCEYSAEAFGGRVLGITRKYLSHEPFFVELGHDFPAVFLDDSFIRITETVERALEALHLNWGPVHVEIRVHENVPKIIEINPRLAGGFIPEIIRLASGLDLIGETIRLTAGEQVRIQAQTHLHASIRFLTPSREGVIRKIEGLAEARAIQGVEEIQMYRQEGERLQIENDFRDRIGHVISCADSLELAGHLAELARDRIEIQVQA